MLLAVTWEVKLHSAQRESLHSLELFRRGGRDVTDLAGQQQVTGK
jgi:hypothetical protein